MPRVRAGPDHPGRGGEAAGRGEDGAIDPDFGWAATGPAATAGADPSRSGSGIITIDAAFADRGHAEAPPPEDGVRQYRVLTQKDQGFAGKFNATKLEEALNDHARRGWSLKAAVTIDVPGHAGHHDELVVILER